MQGRHAIAAHAAAAWWLRRSVSALVRAARPDAARLGRRGVNFRLAVGVVAHKNGLASKLSSQCYHVAELSAESIRNLERAVGERLLVLAIEQRASSTTATVDLVDHFDHADHAPAALHAAYGLTQDVTRAESRANVHVAETRKMR
jgi:hypothetical protein